MNFLIDVLKNSEGGFKFKNSIVEALIDIVSFVPQSKELALENLCDFIEDCEFNEILVRILHLWVKKVHLPQIHHYMLDIFITEWCWKILLLDLLPL